MDEPHRDDHQHEARGTPEERERYRELLEELRTILPGVQVLLAFLLIAPFSDRFEEVDRAGIVIYTVALCGAALAVVTFLTPASFHRVTARSNRRERIRLAIPLTIAGMALLAVAITAAMLLVVRFIHDTTVGTLTALGLALAVAALWYLLPIWKNRRHKARGDAKPPERR